MNRDRMHAQSRPFFGTQPLPAQHRPDNWVVPECKSVPGTRSNDFRSVLEVALWLWFWFGGDRDTSYGGSSGMLARVLKPCYGETG